MVSIYLLKAAHTVWHESGAAKETKRAAVKGAVKVATEEAVAQAQEDMWAQDDPADPWAASGARH